MAVFVAEGEEVASVNMVSTVPRLSLYVIVLVRVND